MSETRGRSVFSAALVLCLLAFVALAWRYAGLVEVWGDEVFSLDLAALPVREIVRLVDVHLPLYYLLLKATLAVLGEADIRWLRLLHAVPLVFGLALGARVLRGLELPAKHTIAAVAAAVLVPSLVFYATNLRMYSLLFFAALWHLDRLTAAVVAAREHTQMPLVTLAASAVLLAHVDWPGLTVIAAGLPLLAAAPRPSRARLAVAALAPVLTLAGYAPVLLPGLSKVLSWPARGGAGSPRALLAQVYASLRPALDLGAPMSPSLILGVAIPAVAALTGVASGAWRLRRWRSSGAGWTSAALAWLALYWLVAAPAGLSLTRAFLPALFFLPALLVAPGPALPRWLRRARLVVFVALVAANAVEALQPTLRLYSRIPFRQIAADAIRLAGSGPIVVSGNSLNARVVRREIVRLDPARTVVVLAPADGDEVVPSGEFLFVCHLGEEGLRVDPARFAGRGGSEVAAYVRLEDLPYNQVWKRQILARAGQPYAVQLYAVAGRCR